MPVLTLTLTLSSLAPHLDFVLDLLPGLLLGRQLFHLLRLFLACLLSLLATCSTYDAGD
jgi:hypothetical protein